MAPGAAAASPGDGVYVCSINAIERFSSFSSGLNGKEGSPDSVDTTQIFANPVDGQRSTAETPFSRLDTLQLRGCNSGSLLPFLALPRVFLFILVQERKENKGDIVEVHGKSAVETRVSVH